MLWARMLADLIVVIHAAYVSFVVFGLLAILVGAVLGWSWVRNFWFRVIHLTAIGIVVAEALAGIPCPLTVWEQRLRKTAGQTGYPGDFLGYWAHQLIFYRRRALGLHSGVRCVRPGGPGRVRAAPPRDRPVRERKR